MKRTSFFKTCSAAFVTAMMIPLNLAAAFTHTKTRTNKGLHVIAGRDRFDKPISLFEGDTFFTKVSSRDSDGDVFVFESTRLKEGGPSYHLHYDQDEFWYVVKGKFQFKVVEENFIATEGDTRIWTKKGSPCIFKNR